MPAGQVYAISTHCEGEEAPSVVVERPLRQGMQSEAFAPGVGRYVLNGQGVQVDDALGLKEPAEQGLQKDAPAKLNLPAAQGCAAPLPSPLK